MTRGQKIRRGSMRMGAVFAAFPLIYAAASLADGDWNQVRNQVLIAAGVFMLPAALGWAVSGFFD